MKPELPPEICARFPAEIVDRIYAFVPHFPKPSKTPTASPICSYSPQLVRDLRMLQSKTVTPKMNGGKKGMYLYDLDEFVLD